MKLLTLIIALSGISMSSCSQDLATSKVPSVVQNALQSKFSNASDVEWKKNNNVYEAEFKINKVEYSAFISDAGKLIYSAVEVLVAEVPESVKSAALSKHPGYQIDDIEKIERDGEIAYEVELESKGKKDIKVIVLQNGTISDNFTALK